MFDRLLKLDLDKVKENNANPSFIVFHDGRIVLTNNKGHGQIIIKTCRKYYPKRAYKFDVMIQNEQNHLNNNISETDKERLSCMTVLNNDFLENNGFVIMHNKPVVGLVIFGFPKMTEKQIKAINKISNYFRVDMWPDFYI